MRFEIIIYIVLLIQQNLITFVNCETAIIEYYSLNSTYVCSIKKDDKILLVLQNKVGWFDEKQVTFESIIKDIDISCFIFLDQQIAFIYGQNFYWEYPNKNLVQGMSQGNNFQIDDFFEYLNDKIILIYKQNALYKTFNVDIDKPYQYQVISLFKDQQNILIFTNSLLKQIIFLFKDQFLLIESQLLPSGFQEIKYALYSDQNEVMTTYDNDFYLALLFTQGQNSFQTISTTDYASYVFTSTIQQNQDVSLLKPVIILFNQNNFWAYPLRNRINNNQKMYIDQESFNIYLQKRLISIIKQNINPNKNKYVSDPNKEIYVSDPTNLDYQKITIVNFDYFFMLDTAINSIDGDVRVYHYIVYQNKIWIINYIYNLDFTDSNKICDIQQLPNNEIIVATLGSIYKYSQNSLIYTNTVLLNNLYGCGVAHNYIYYWNQSQIYRVGCDDTNLVFQTNTTYQISQIKAVAEPDQILVFSKYYFLVNTINWKFSEQNYWLLNFYGYYLCGAYSLSLSFINTRTQKLINKDIIYADNSGFVLIYDQEQKSYQYVQSTDFIIQEYQFNHFFKNIYQVQDKKFKLIKNSQNKFERKPFLVDWDDIEYVFQQSVVFLEKKGGIFGIDQQNQLTFIEFNLDYIILSKIKYYTAYYQDFINPLTADYYFRYNYVLDKMCLSSNYFKTSINSQYTSCQYQIKSSSTPYDIYCDPNCMTCDTFNIKKCLTCFSGAISNSQNVCVCLEAYYLKSVKPYICEKCLNGCKVCQNGIICQQCQIGRIGSQCSCPLGYYDDFLNFDCQKCPAECKECDQNQCKKCLNPKRLVGMNCKCGENQQVDPNTDYCICISGYMFSGVCYSNCPSSYYKDDLDQTCKECSKECIECVNTPTNCTIRNDCNLGYYKDSIDYTCKICPVGCSECKSNLKCTKCSDYRYLYANECMLICPQGYYKDNLINICSPCSVFCSSCIDGTSNCDICSQFAYKEIDTGLCISQCKEQYFTNELIKQCEPCHPNCSKCVGSLENQCLNCITNLYLEDGKCVQKCKKVALDGICVNQCPYTYYINTENECKKCSQLCLECVDRQDKCTKCAASIFYLSSSFSCLQKCPSNGYYSDTSNYTCNKCLQGCIQCDNQSQCLKCEQPLVLNKQRLCTGSCESNQVIYRNQCLDSCPSSTYQLSNQCFDCNIACKACLDDSTKCSECSASGLRLDDQCLLKCPEDYFSDINKICQRCNETCNSCKGPGNQDCFTCKIGLFFYNGQCVTQCPNLVQDNQCVNSCSESYYLLSKQCQLCHPFCKQCIDSSVTCPICSDLAFKFNSECTNICPQGYYGDIQTRRCEKCNISCKTCFDSSGKDCLSCKEGNFLQNNECVLTCKYFFYKGECLKQCPSKTYPDWKQKICMSCDILCNQCIDETNVCSECSQLSYRSIDQKSCVHECPDNSYPDLDRTCKACHTSCFKCFGEKSNNCNSCLSNLYFANNQCYDKCPLNFYPQNNSNTCIICDSNGKQFEQCKKSITLKLEAVNGSWNKIKLDFSESLLLPQDNERFLNEQLVVRIQDVKEFKIEIQKTTNTQFILTIITNAEFIEQKRIYVSFKDPTKIVSKTNNILSNDYKDDVQKDQEDGDNRLYAYLQPSINLGDKESLSNSSQNAVIVLSGFLLPMQILSSQIISSLMINIAQILNYFMYIDMYLPSNLEISLKMLKFFNLDFLPSIGDDESIQSKISGEMEAKDKQFFGQTIIGQKARYRFEQRGKLTTSFMLNGMNKINIIFLRQMQTYDDLDELEDLKSKQYYILQMLQNLAWGLISLFLLMILQNIIYIIKQLYTQIKIYLEERKTNKNSELNNLQNYLSQQQIQLFCNSKQQQLSSKQQEEQESEEQKQQQQQQQQQQLQQQQQQIIELNEITNNQLCSPFHQDSYLNQKQNNQLTLDDIQNSMNNNEIKWIQNPILKNFQNNINY
ncbi:hypothetical protein ABPG72_010610 [Tetrahymena utriculariae]